ncbi:hypothetical protein AVEN_148907-1 [Araneus ventricosus]|uniref:Uncharacterized protein n=1 Tax=Araneus ventricosus TaxID=182803 RepID=A0A4Y2DLM3_ARAVE|nr:hypothetical protein AVEN_148907-1 [Araneus ventricosus]
MIWREPTNHIDGCYFCMVPPASVGFTKKKKRTIEYPNIPSALRPVSLGEGLPIPEPPTDLSVSFCYEEDLDVSHNSPQASTSACSSTEQSLCTASREIGLRASFKPGEMNAEQPPLEELHKIIIPPLYIKLDLGKNLAKSMDKNGSAFKYLHETFSRLGVTKIKEGFFVGASD